MDGAKVGLILPEMQKIVMFLENAWWMNAAFAVLVFLFFLLLCRVLTSYVLKIILRLARDSQAFLGEVFLRALGPPLRVLFIVLGVYFALIILPLSQQQNILVLRSLRVALILLFTWGIYNLAGTYLSETTVERFNLPIDRILVPFFSKIVKAIILAISLSIVIQEWGYEISGLIAGLGLGGLAVALAAQDAIANIFGGVVIITDKPFTIGDWISTPSVEGIVEDITFRSTKVRGFAQSLISVPNKMLADEPITNWTRMGKRRVDFYLGLSYTTPPAKLKKCVQLMRELLETHPGVHAETIYVFFEIINESSLDIFFYFFTVATNKEEHLRVREDINYKLLEILENEGVSLALPSRSLYMERTPGPNPGKQA